MWNAKAIASIDEIPLLGFFKVFFKRTNHITINIISLITKGTPKITCWKSEIPLLRIFLGYLFFETLLSRVFVLVLNYARLINCPKTLRTHFKIFWKYKTIILKFSVFFLESLGWDLSIPQVFFFQDPLPDFIWFFEIPLVLKVHLPVCASH